MVLYIAITKLLLGVVSLSVFGSHFILDLNAFTSGFHPALSSPTPSVGHVTGDLKQRESNETHFVLAMVRRELR